MAVQEVAHSIQRKSGGGFLWCYSGVLQFNTISVCGGFKRLIGSSGSFTVPRM